MLYTPNALDAILEAAEHTLPGVWMYLADSKNLVLGSLEKAGNVIGLAKSDVGDNIKRMDYLWLDNPTRFIQYSARDSIITAQVIAYYAKAFAPLTGGELATRIAKYSEIHFKKLFQKMHYENSAGSALPVSKITGLAVNVAKNIWKPPMGYREVTRHEDIHGEALTKFIRCVVGDNVPAQACPTTMDELVEYIIVQKERGGGR